MIEQFYFTNRSNPNKYCYILTYADSHLHTCTYICRIIHNDTVIKTQEDFFNKIFTSHFIARVRKGLFKVCVWEGAGDRTETSIFWPPLLWPSTLCLFRSPDAQPKALGSTLLDAGSLYCILSATSRPGVAFPTTSRLSPPPTLLELAPNLKWSQLCLDWAI